jgi:hypothetical protein
MNCDLCEKRPVRTKKSQLCNSCAEMIQRLIIVQQRMDLPEPRMVAAAAAGGLQGHTLASL